MDITKRPAIPQFNNMVHSKAFVGIGSLAFMQQTLTPKTPQFPMLNLADVNELPAIFPVGIMPNSFAYWIFVKPHVVFEK